MKDLDVCIPSFECPFEDCGTPKGPGQLMCRRHWFMAPRALRDAVWRAVYARLAGDIDLDELRAAQRDCVTAAEDFAARQAVEYPEGQPME